MGGGGGSVPTAPDERQMERLASVLAPLARVTQPKLFGIERIPDRGVLFVGNHTRYAFLDLPFMMSELWTRRQIVVRGLGAHGHYAIPVWRDLLEMAGMVRGTRENVRALMREGQSILVYPGGADEVLKGRGLDYQLMWKERLGFARLAIEFGYPIVPFAAVGAEESFHVVADRDMPFASQVSALMRRLVGVPLPPLVRGIGPTLIPRPERLYFWFAEPIDTSRYEARPTEASARALRDEVKAAVQAGIQMLLAEREDDPHRGLVARLLQHEHDLPALAIDDPNAWLVMRAFEAWNEHGAVGAAAWMSRRVQLAVPGDRGRAETRRGRDATLERLEQLAAELRAERVEVTEAQTVNGEVLTEFTVHPVPGWSGKPEAFAALVDVAEGQIARIRLFTEVSDALAAGARSPKGVRLE